MLADPAIRSLPGRLGPEERRPECPVGRGRGDCDAAHEILKTNMKTIIYQSYDIIVSIYQVYTWYISCINLVYDDVQAYTWHTPTQNFLGFFSTCHVTVWT